jgi:hypothetical protein
LLDPISVITIFVANDHTVTAARGRTGDRTTIIIAQVAIVAFLITSLSRLEVRATNAVTAASQVALIGAAVGVGLVPVITGFVTGLAWRHITA